MPESENAEDLLSPNDVDFVFEDLRARGVLLRYGNHRTVTKRERKAIGLHILKRRLNGERQTDIAADLDISTGLVSKLKNEALDLIELPSQERARAEHIEYCDRIIDAFIGKAALGDDKAANTVLKALAERAKSTGAYTPVEVTGTITEITPQERELQELLAQAERDAAVKAAELTSSVPE